MDNFGIKQFTDYSEEQERKIAAITAELDLLKREKQDECHALRAALEHETKAHLETSAELDKIAALVGDALGGGSGTAPQLVAKVCAELERVREEINALKEAWKVLMNSIPERTIRDLRTRLAAAEADCLSVTRGNVELMQECDALREQVAWLKTDEKRLDFLMSQLDSSWGYPPSQLNSREAIDAALAKSKSSIEQD